MNTSHIRYTCPQCGHGGAHPDTLPAPLCDKCEYKVTMIKVDPLVGWNPAAGTAITASGEVLQSKDDGSTWRAVNAAPTDEQKKAHIRSMIAAGCDLDAIGRRYFVVRKPGEPCADYRDRIQESIVTDDLTTINARLNQLMIDAERAGFVYAWYKEFQAVTRARILYAENELDTLEDRTYRLISDAQKEGVIITITVPVSYSTDGPLIMKANFVRVTK